MSLPVAIIGMACRFPGVASPDSLWNLLLQGREAVGEIPLERARLFERSRSLRGAGRVPWQRGGFLEGLELFDARFFGVAPREAERIDPQQRLLLETSWEALEDAGMPASKLRGSATGVFMGTWTADYERLMFESELTDFYMTTGGGRSSSAGRLSYVLGLEGPSLAVDTACSSSLVAVHLACQSLMAGECDLALAGGANVILEPSITVAYGRARMLSPDGRCKFGDACADGYVRSEGAGVVLLKPLARAIEDGDPVRAVIRASAVSHDGSTSSSIGRPAVAGQRRTLVKAYESAGVDPTAISYVEAHGTGTKAGDPVEVEALASVLGSGAGRNPETPLLVGSIKTNLGHTESASGIAGLLKLVLSLQNEAIPKSLHVSERNPAIDWAGLGVTLVTETTPWPRSARARLAGLNSFGISGTNAHLVLEESPRAVTPTSSVEAVPAPYLLPISARTPEALRAAVAGYQSFLSRTTASFADVAVSAAQDRDHHGERYAVVCRDRAQAIEKLGARLPPRTRRSASPSPKVAFVFPGQGSQWIGMGRGLMALEPVFRERIEACEEAFRPHVDWALTEVLASDEDDCLGRIDVVQPVLFALEISLSALWHHFGVRPDVVVGHSMGEVAAAHVAGGLSLEDAARIICERSRLLLGASGRGSMMMVELSLNEAERLIEDRGCADRVSVAVSNSARSTVLSGDSETLRSLADELEATDVFCRFVKVDVASHSPQMDALTPDLVSLLARLEPRMNVIPMHSTVTGARVEGTALDADYWVRNLRRPVLFAKAVRDLLDEGVAAFIEVSPHPILLPALEQASAFALPSMRREEDERTLLFESLGELYVRGAGLDWKAIYPTASPHTRLPSYPWQRKRFWLDFGDKREARLAVESSRAPEEGALFWKVAWERQPSKSLSAEVARAFILVDGASDFTDGLERRLVAGGSFVSRADRAAGAEAVAGAIASALEREPERLEVVHLGAVGSSPEPELSADAWGLESFLDLVRAADERTAIRVSVVSAAAHPIGGAPVVVRPESWPLLGLSRVATQEYPELALSRIDLGSTEAADLDALVAELSSGSRNRDEDVALRGDARFVARLAPWGVDGEAALPALQHGAYLVTGGLGGLGLRVARLLAQGGARRVGLMGRSAPGLEAERELAVLRKLGVDVVVIQGDVTDAAVVDRALEDLRSAETPLRGIVHAAGVLEDGILLGLDRGSLARVMAPKVEGAFHLHRASWNDPLDFFVLFSSVVSLLGTSGQGSYAAANAYLDGLAHHRRSLGRPALAVHWAPWAEVGLAARLGGSAHMERRGIGTLPAERAVAALRALIGRDDVTEIAVMPFSAEGWVAAHPHRKSSSFLERLLGGSHPGEDGGCDEELEDESVAFRTAWDAATDTKARRSLVEAIVCEHVSGVTRLERSEIEIETPFKSFGLDSLMGLELRNRMERAAGLRLSATIVWSYPTVARLTEYLLRRLETETAGGAVAGAGAGSGNGNGNGTEADDLVALLEGVQELESDEVETMLAQKREEKTAR